METLRIVVNPALDAAGVDALVRIWVEVTNAGGAVGLVAPTTEEQARDLCESTLARVAAGLEDVVVAFDGEEPVAFGFLTRNASPIDGHWATVTRLQRSLAQRGSGVGSAVLAALEERARALGLEFLQLAVRGGTGRERYYAAKGWRLVAVLPRWLRIGAETRDALIMVKPLTASADFGAVALPVPLRRLDPDLPLPRYAHPGDAGLDLHAREDVTLGPGERALVPTGVAVAIPEGHVGLVHPRSGLAVRHGVSLVNAPGTIDAGYRGELLVPLINHDRTEPVTLRRGDRIAQLLVLPLARAALVEVDELPEAARSAGGFGSTGA